VLLVAVHAGLVPCGSRAPFGGVTRRAFGDEGAAVRFVALLALGVTLRRHRRDLRVARGARRFHARRPMRQPGVTSLAGLMPRVRGHERKLLCVAALAGPVLGQLDAEVMRLVALFTFDAPVECVIGRRELMARAARSRDCGLQGWGRVRIVAPDARAACVGMVRVNVPMTPRAHLIAGAAHIVR
jgi:hypothetical protein